MARSSGAVYVAVETGVADVNGHELPFTRGVTRVREGHPLLKGRMSLFKLVDDAVHYDIESATAAPGEKRGS